MNYSYFTQQVSRLEDTFGKQLASEKSRLFFEELKHFDETFVRLVFDDIIANGRYLPTMDDIKKACSKINASNNGEFKRSIGCPKCSYTTIRDAFHKEELRWFTFRCDCAPKDLKGVKFWSDSYRLEYIDNLDKADEYQMKIFKARQN